MAYEPVKQETKDQYTKIWTHHTIGKFNKAQLAQLFGCDEDTILNAINWGAKNRLSLKTAVLTEATKEFLENVIRDCSNDITALKASATPNWSAIIGVRRTMLEACEKLWKIEGVIVEKGGLTVNNNMVSGANNLALLRDDLISGLDEEGRKRLAEGLRRLIARQEALSDSTEGNGTSGLVGGEHA